MKRNYSTFKMFCRNGWWQSAGAVEQTPFQMRVPRSSLNGDLNLLCLPQSPETVGYEWTLQTSCTKLNGSKGYEKQSYPSGDRLCSGKTLGTVI